MSEPLEHVSSATVDLGIVAALVSSRDVVLVDTSCHASLIDGGKMSSGSVRSFRHNSVSTVKGTHTEAQIDEALEAFEVTRSTLD